MTKHLFASLLAISIALATCQVTGRELAIGRSPSESPEQELIKIHESAKPIECSGIKQLELAAESQIVAVHFEPSPLEGPTISVGAKQQHDALYSRATKQPAKQSQEFDIAEQQQQQQTTSSLASTDGPALPGSSEPAAQVESSSGASSGQLNCTKPISDNRPTGVLEPLTVGNETASGQTASSTQSMPTTTSVSPVSEPNVVVEQQPVGTKIIRQGDAVLCGEANPNGKSNKRLVLDRIVGGRKTEPGEFPFQVRLNIRSRRGSGICGGVILDRYHILTAAHCMTACASQQLTTAIIETSGVHATVGDHSIKSNDGELELEVDKITAHEKYDACNFYANDHDIALIRTSSPIEYRFTTDGYGSINRPCMPRDGELSYRDGEQVIVSGWGVTRENSGSLSNILRYVQVPIVNTTKCQEVYGSRVTRDHVCAGYQAGGKDSCQGDSGGPLVRVVENRYELVGIVSFGYGCGQPGAPGVYTRVASYVEWIRDTIAASGSS